MEISDVQGAPVDLVDEGVNRAHHHGAPPHSRLVVLHTGRASELGSAGGDLTTMTSRAPHPAFLIPHVLGRTRHIWILQQRRSAHVRFCSAYLTLPLNTCTGALGITKNACNPDSGRADTSSAAQRHRHGPLSKQKELLAALQ